MKWKELLKRILEVLRLDKMVRWQKLFGKSAIVASYIYHNEPELARELANSDKPRRVLDEYFSKDENKTIEELKETIEELRSENREKSNRINELQEEIQNFYEENEHKKYWNSKHPKKDVKYKRPIYEEEGKWEIYDIPVVDFVMPHDFEIQDRIKSNDLQVDNPLKIDEIAPKIYDEAKKNYNYEYDSKHLGMSEFWKFPPETMASDGGDCEDWAHVIASFLIGAGVPRWRVRVTYGYINKGDYGHSTVYVLGDDMETWYHLNSTSPHYSRDKLSDYPEFGDTSDDLGIDPDEVWGSFNNKHAWKEIENDQSKKDYKNHSVSDKVVIE